jgi:hypothetical protein
MTKNKTKTVSQKYFDGRKYYSELGGAFGIYMLVLYLTIGRVEESPTATIKMALAVAPVFPLLLVFWAIMRQYGRSDELDKRIAREAFAMGAMIFGWILIIWGFAQNGGAPQVPMIFVAPLLICFWGICTPIVMRKYK